MKIWGGYGQASRKDRQALIQAIREGRVETPEPPNLARDYGGLTPEQLQKIAFKAHLLIYAMAESDDRRWWQEEIYGVKAALEEAGLNCTPSDA